MSEIDPAIAAAIAEALRPLIERLERLEVMLGEPTDTQDDAT